MYLVENLMSTSRKSKTLGMSTTGRDVSDQERLFKDVTKVLEPNEGSTRPKRSPKIPQVQLR